MCVRERGEKEGEREKVRGREVVYTVVTLAALLPKNKPFMLNFSVPVTAAVKRTNWCSRTGVVCVWLTVSWFTLPVVHVVLHSQHIN